MYALMEGESRKRRTSIAFISFYCFKAFKGEEVCVNPTIECRYFMDGPILKSFTSKQDRRNNT